MPYNPVMQPHHPFLLDPRLADVTHGADGVMMDPMRPPPTRWNNHGVEDQAGTIHPANGSTQAGITNSKSYFVDSRTRVVSRNASANDFDVIFDRTLRNVTSVRLISAIVPIINNNAGAHGATPNYQANPYVMLHVKPLGDSANGRGSTLDAAFGDGSNASAPGDRETRNSIADADSIVAIPLIPNGPNIDVTGGGVVVNFTHWEDKAEHDAVLRFKSPLASLKGLTFTLYSWGSSTAPRTERILYPLGDEAVPSITVSGLDPWRQVQYQVEIISSN